jgi:hypothetical protein
VAALALAVLAALALAPAARAEAGTGVRPAGLSPSGSGVSIQAATHTLTNGAWSCTLSVNVPSRWYGGSGGGVQGAGWLNCNYVVQELEILVGLIRNNVVVNTVGEFDTNTIQVNHVASVSPYVRATYLTAALGYVKWPDGTEAFFPEVQSIARTI